jgi:hypothetical protein
MLVIIGVLNQFGLTAATLERMVTVTVEADILLIDNGSDRPLAKGS